METLYQPGDIFMTRGESFISKCIRFFTRSFGEKRSKVNHVGIVVQEGVIRQCIIIEARSRTRKIKLISAYGPPNRDKVAIYRPLNLSPDQLNIIVAEAEEQVGKVYGFLKIATHLLDWCLQGAYVFRRLTNSGNYPICSWLVAHAFAKAGKNFGVAPGAANPDDIWDFVVENPDKYQCVRPLESLEEDERVAGVTS